MLKPYVFFESVCMNDCPVGGHVICPFPCFSSGLILFVQCLTCFFLPELQHSLPWLLQPKQFFFFLLSRCHSQENALDKCAVSFFFFSSAVLELFAVTTMLLPYNKYNYCFLSGPHKGVCSYGDIHTVGEQACACHLKIILIHFYG